MGKTISERRKRTPEERVDRSASAKRRQRIASLGWDDFMATFTSIHSLSNTWDDPSHDSTNHPDTEGAGKHLNDWQTIGYEADGHSSGCTHTFRRNAYVSK